ncbi:ammonium transporter [Chryseobacterium sp. Ch-15]|uniref:Ammonium transporter n=1 Tax=Chryseobacterium muglaense TaxID=2893752 RepID=A0A9Q3UU63_9FLAO|nr:ammonium transporter [Chryseobacterium muglaense]MBD3905212.1 ammonium transporter [Chryseobacterium muglaense]MCC9034083.1 ammonium transporter [Chryseobacterium muglaense]MCM2555076.1 ammonium transporter [Chryseobacterium muglaense]
MKVGLKWKVSFVVICIVAIGGLFFRPDVDIPNTGNFLSEKEIVGSDVAWILAAAGLVLLMTPGLSFFYGGMVGKKNVISTMLQSFIALGVISILWIVVGFSLSFGESIGFEIDGVHYGIIGNPFTYPFFNHVSIYPHKAMASTIPFVLFALFQMKFAVITPALITGSFAERVRFISYLVFMVLFSLFIYTPLCHMVWHPEGLLNKFFGVKDFAGGTVVHMSAGFAALAGAIVLGRRKNPHHEPSNIPYVILGTGMLWFGWFGFNAGSALSANATAAIAFGTTTIASASAMMTWIFFDRINGRKVSALGACIGAVVGLVAITPGCGFVSIQESIFIGFISAIVSNIMLNWKALKKIDDTLDVFACHGVGGIMGMILTAVFAHGENASFLHGGFGVFAHHMMALILVSFFAFFGSMLLYKITDQIITLRVSEDSENEGLDMSQHHESLKW